MDVDAKTLNALPEKVMEARTSKTRAVMLAHTLGNPYRSDILAEWCRSEGLYLVEDCCDALGATVSGKPIGFYGATTQLSAFIPLIILQWAKVARLFQEMDALGELPRACGTGAETAGATPAKTTLVANVLAGSLYRFLVAMIINIPIQILATILK